MKYLYTMMAFFIILAAAGCSHNPPEPSAEPLPQREQTATPTPALPPVPSTLAPQETCYVTGNAVHIRAQAGKDADIICTLPYGTPLTRVSEDGAWTQVRYDENIAGFIHSEYISDAQPARVELPEPQPLSSPKIVVKKAQRLLELWDGTALVGRFAVGLGWTPQGHKQREGDGKTPEGSYYVCVRNDHSRFYLSLGVSYPNKQDAEAALKSGLIDEATYTRIASAIDNRERPSWSTPLGGEIMIHGHGSHSDWTAGCIAVDDDVMDVLWAACPLGTPIEIRP